MADMPKKIAAYRVRLSINQVPVQGPSTPPLLYDIHRGPMAVKCCAKEADNIADILFHAGVKSTEARISAGHHPLFHQGAPHEAVPCTHQQIDLQSPKVRNRTAPAMVCVSWALWKFDALDSLEVDSGCKSLLHLSVLTADPLPPPRRKTCCKCA